MTGSGVVGAVLTGGRSTRMGTDKAFVEVGGVPLVRTVADALLLAGAEHVMAVGGDGPRLMALGLGWWPDDHPGEGPLGAILTALRGATGDPVLVVACDMPGLDPAALSVVLGALGPDDDVALPVHDGRLEPLHAAYRRRALGPLSRAFAAGERAPHRALAGLRTRTVMLDDPASLRNVNTLDDLP